MKTILALLIGTLFMGAAPPRSAAPDESAFVSFNEHAGSSRYGELICYRTKHGKRSEINLVRCGVSEPKLLFSKLVSEEAYAPICIRNGVVVTEIGGRVSRYDLQGNVIFSSMLEGFDGVSKFGTRLNEQFIIVERSWFNKGTPPSSFDELLFVDISGKSPTIIGRLSTEPIGTVMRVGAKLFGCGSEKVWELKIPEGVSSSGSAGSVLEK